MLFISLVDKWKTVQIISLKNDSEVRFHDAFIGYVEEWELT